jgi:hypothetical protein
MEMLLLIVFLTVLASCAHLCLRDAQYRHKDPRWNAMRSTEQVAQHDPRWDESPAVRAQRAMVN